jgi:hypothetical protein
MGVESEIHGGIEYERDKWVCTLHFGDRKESFEYGTGSGLRKNNTPVKPVAADVVYSVLSDYSAGEESFEDFCSNFGYDNDSIKALNTYIACQRNGKKVLNLFRETLEELQKAEH